MNQSEALEKVEGLVRKMARKYMPFVQNGNMDLDDLLQVGRQGVLQAYKKFDPSINPHFPTYAGWWIRASLRAECMQRGRTVRVSVGHQVKEYQKGTPVAIRNIHIDKVSPFLRAPEQERDNSLDVKKLIDAALGSLKPRHREVIKMRFFEEKTLAEIGEHLGVSRERARQLCEKAMDIMIGEIPEHAKDYLE